MQFGIREPRLGCARKISSGLLYIYLRIRSWQREIALFSGSAITKMVRVEWIVGWEYETTGTSAEFRSLYHGSSGKVKAMLSEIYDQ